jgi:putative DNA primase/helicase
MSGVQPIPIVPAMAEGRDDDEWRKRISAKLFAAAPVVFLDNLTRRLDSSAVATAITSPRWEDRILGRSRCTRCR